jgi:hypothetical protein|tara:strand:- start:453 stop:656 length:204 start_codon:yes stop_codon:yes gene_type:complete
LSSWDRAFHLNPLAEHVVVPVLQHDTGAVFSLKRDETEPARLVVVRIAHHEHLHHRAELVEEVAHGA